MFTLAYQLASNRRLLFLGLAFNVLVRVVSVFFHYFLGHIPFIGLGFPDSQEDAIFFYKRAMALSVTDIMQNLTKAFTDGVLLYKIVLKFVMLFTFSDHILILALFNSVLSLLTVYNCYRISNIIWKDYKAAVLTVFILACLPVFITYSMITLRESIVAFFFSWSMLKFMDFYENGRIKNLILTLILIVCGGLFHGGLMVAIPLVLFCAVFYLTKFKDVRVKNLVRLCIVCLGLAGILTIWNAGLGADKLAHLSSEEDKKEFVKGRIEVLELRGNSELDYGNFVDIYSVNDLFRASPYLYANFLFRPKPLEYLADVFRLPGSWVMYFGVIFIILNFRIIFNQIDKRILLIILFGTWFVFSLGCFNVGQADRHRMKLLPVFVAVVAKPVSDFRIKRFLNWK